MAEPCLRHEVRGSHKHIHAHDRSSLDLDGLRAAGYRDVEPMMRGSAVTGENFRTGVPFDVRRTSDYDVALVSPTLMQRAIELGIPLRGGGTRTEPTRGRSLEGLGLASVRDTLRAQEGRPVSFMIYSSRYAVTRRGPSRPILGQ
jgi:filamentous hemagglutinin